jgi:hypothetical protein
MPAERVLVNFFYAHPVGHAVALHYCLGHYAADPTREVAVALNGATAVELAGYCRFVSRVYAVDHPLLERCADSAARQALIPTQWDWVLDDFRRRQDFQLAAFPGLRDYYSASDLLLTATRGRTVVSSDPPGYVPHQQLRFELPESARARARILDDLHRIVTAASELLSGSVTYQQSLHDYFSDLLTAHRGDARAIWSIDNVHLDYLPTK